MLDKLSQKSNRRQFLKLAGSTAGAATLAGCTGGNNEDSDGSGGDSTDTVAQDDDSSSGGSTQSSSDVPVLTWVKVGAILDYMDPAYEGGGSGMVPTVVYDTGLSLDHETTGLKPHLFTEWTNEDGTWVFKLQEGVMFHDGKEMTAEDVRWSLERMMKLQRGFSYLWQGLVDPDDGIRAPDKYTFEVDTSQPYGPFVATMIQLRVANKEQVMANSSGDNFGHDYLQRNMAGSGPYEMVNYSQGEAWEGKRHEDYFLGWDDPSPTGASGTPFERCRVIQVSEQNTIANLYGERDALLTDDSLAPETYQQIADQDGTKILNARAPTYHFGPINTTIPPTDDIHVRKAIKHAFNYKTAIEQIEGGQHPRDRARGPVPNVLVGHNDEITPLKYDLEKAEAEIERSSYTVDEINEIGITQYNTDPSGIRPQEHLLLQSALAELGIKTEITQTPWAEYSSLASKAETSPQIGIHNMGLSTPSPDSFLYQQHHPDAMGSYQSMAWYTDPELTDLIEKARSTLDSEERLEVYKQAQQVAWEGHSALYISNPPWRVATHEPVKGIKSFGINMLSHNAHNLRWDP